MKAVAIMSFFLSAYLQAQYPENSYKVLTQFNEVEVREYPPQLFASYIEKNQNS